MFHCSAINLRTKWQSRTNDSLRLSNTHTQW